jgi:hypothetical protein
VVSFLYIRIITLPTAKEAEDHRKLARYGVMRSLAVGECTGSCDLYCDGRSVLPVLTRPYRTPSQKLLSCELLTISEAAAVTKRILWTIITEITHFRPGRYTL